MQITIAKNAGFCFGVRRATDSLESTIRDAREGEKIYTLGHLIHNRPYNEKLSAAGVECISIDDIDRVAAEAESAYVTVFVRAHGIPRQDEEKLRMIAKKNEKFRYVDCTCPYVKKIHRIAEENSSSESALVLCGSEKHPEVVGILSYFD